MISHLITMIAFFGGWGLMFHSFDQASTHVYGTKEHSKYTLLTFVGFAAGSMATPYIAVVIANFI